MYHKRALRREETLSLEMYHFQPPKNSSWHLHHLPLGAKTHLRKAISTAHSQLDGSTLDHFLYNLRKHGFQFVFARYLQRHLCIHIKKHVFLIVHNTSTPTKKNKHQLFSTLFKPPITSHLPPKRTAGTFHYRCIPWFRFHGHVADHQSASCCLGTRWSSPVR